MAVVAAGGLGVGALTKMVTTVAELRTGLIAMGVSAKTASVSMGAIGIALAGASLLLGGWIQKQSEAKAIADQYAQAMRDQGAALGELSRATAEKNLLDSGMINNAKLLGLTVKDLTGSIEGNATAQQKVADATTATIVAWENGKASKEQLDAARALNKELPKQAAAFAAAADAAAETEAAQRELSSATDKSADASKLDARAKSLQNDSIEAQKQKLDAAIQSASAYADIMLRLSGSAIGLEQAIDDVRDLVDQRSALLGDPPRFPRQRLIEQQDPRRLTLRPVRDRSARVPPLVGGRPVELSDVQLSLRPGRAQERPVSVREARQVREGAGQHVHGLAVDLVVLLGDVLRPLALHVRPDPVP